MKKKRKKRGLIWLLLAVMLFGEVGKMPASAAESGDVSAAKTMDAGAAGVSSKEISTSAETLDLGFTASTQSSKVSASFRDFLTQQEEEVDAFGKLQVSNQTAKKLTLSWYSQGNNDSYIVYRKCEYDSDYKQIGEVENSRYETLTFTDKDFVRGINFTYKITACRTGEDGEDVLGASLTLETKADIPGVKIKSAKKSGKKVTLTWKKAAAVSGYEIYRKVSGGSYEKVKTVAGAENVSATVKLGTTEKSVKYKVRAYTTYSGNRITGPYGEGKTVRTSSQQKLAKKFKKLQKKYPDGCYWNHVGMSSYSYKTVTDTPCHHASVNDLSTCNYYNCPNGVIGFQCYGFAWLMSDEIYGRNAGIKNFTSFDKCKVGDVIRYSGHSVIVTEKHKNYVVVGECNYGDTCKISWGRKVYREELTNAKYSRRK